jgi:hypothetical protein
VERVFLWSKRDLILAAGKVLKSPCGKSSIKEQKRPIREQKRPYLAAGKVLKSPCPRTFTT